MGLALCAVAAAADSGNKEAGVGSGAAAKSAKSNQSNELNSHITQNSVPASSLAGDGGGVDLISPR